MFFFVVVVIVVGVLVDGDAGRGGAWREDEVNARRPRCVCQWCALVSSSLVETRQKPRPRTGSIRVSDRETVIVAVVIIVLVGVCEDKR